MADYYDDDPLWGASSSEERRPKAVPTIQVVAGRLPQITDEAELALLAAGAEIFQRADQLVRPGHSEVGASDDRNTIASGLHALAIPALREELSLAADWQRYDARAKKWRTIDAPSDVTATLAARVGRWKFRSIAGVISCPTLRHNGSILSEPGYDQETHLYYMPDPAFKLPELPERPDRADAERGLALLSRLLTEFPFCTETDRAVALSMILSAVVRGALGMVPLHAFTAPTPGSGKSYLADITSAIVSGRICPVITPGRTEEELEKRLGAMLLSGYPMISLDNISNGLSGDALCQVAERPTVRIRVLGKSETPECEFRGMLIANGNNLSVIGDMTRRVLLGRLDAGIENPEDRAFACDPVVQVLADRGGYVGAAMNVVRAYRAAGMPGKLNPLASYGKWSDLVRSALVWLGLPDPVDSMRETRAADPVLGTLRAVLAAWCEAIGEDEKSAAEIADTLNGFDPAAPTGEAMIALRNALAAVATVRGNIDQTRLGYWLRSNKGRPAGGLKFTSRQGHRGVTHWSVTTA